MKSVKCAEGFGEETGDLIRNVEMEEVLVVDKHERHVMDVLTESAKSISSLAIEIAIPRGVSRKHSQPCPW